MNSAAPQLGLLATPTPLEFAPRLSAALDGPRIYVKRDDTTTVGLGGNKIRKLDFLVADAIANGADTLVTIGGLQSNHCRQTAAVAARHGLQCQILLVETASSHGQLYARTGNVLLSRLFGAEVTLIAEPTDRARALLDAGGVLRRRGRSPYIVPAGGSSAIGCLGYVDAAREIAEQCNDLGISPSAIVHTSGSGGTQAGLLVGLAQCSSTIPVLGISCGKSSEALKMIVADLIGQICALSTLRPDTIASPVVLDDYVGPGYALPNADTIDAIRLCARTEGLILDPVYTGKSMAGLIDQIGKRRFAPEEAVIYLHTGGSPAIFAYEDQLW